jgi:sugar phosphate isomerase/epimerase
MTALNHCFSTLGCSQFSMREVADLAQRHGVGSIELRGLSGSLDLPTVLAAEFESPVGFAKFLSDRGLRVVALNTSIRLFEGGCKLSAIEPYLPWAEAAGAVHLRIFDGGDRLSEADFALAIADLDAWQEHRRSRGLKAELMIETHNALADVEQLVEFIGRVPSSRILWDTHHTWAKGADVVSTWNHIAQNVVHLHVKDSAIGPDERRHYVEPGKGTFPMAVLKPLLLADNRSLPVSLEWERHWHRELPPLEDALVAARSWW